MSRIAVFVATTGAPVRVERITRERAPQSVVCLKRTSTVLPISASYDAFVRLGSGVVERTFGPFAPGAFRLDVSSAIDSGDSWQLGFFIAHALCGPDGGLLAQEEDADTILWLSGHVDYDLAVGSVGHLAEKVHASYTALGAWVTAGRKVIMCVREGPDHDTVKAAGVPQGVKLVAVRSASDVLALLNQVMPACAPQTQRPPSPSSPSQRLRPAPLALAGAIASAAIAGIALARLFSPAALPDLSASPENPDALVAPAPLASPAVAVQVMPATAEKAAMVHVTAQPVGPVDSAAGPRLSIFERHAPEGHTCAQVQFGGVAAVNVPLTDRKDAATASQSLCGLGVAVDNGATARFVTLQLDVVSGHLLYGTVRPDYFAGRAAFTGARQWAIDLPRRLEEPFEIKVSASGQTESVPPDGHSGAGTLGDEPQPFTTSLLHYRLAP